MSRLPAIVPEGWKVLNFDDGQCIMKTDLGLTGAFRVIEILNSQERTLRSGLYKYLQLSRPNRNPEWQEMLDFIRQSKLFVDNRPLIIIVEREAPKFTFHWYQLIAR